MGSLMPEAGVKFTFDADLAVDIHGNLAFTGGAGMTVTLPVNRSLLILRVRAITLAFALEGTGGSVKASLAATVGFGLDFGGAFKVDVDNIGARLAWTLPSSPSAAGEYDPDRAWQSGPLGDSASSCAAARDWRVDRRRTNQGRRVLSSTWRTAPTPACSRLRCVVWHGHPDQGRRPAARDRLRLGFRAYPVGRVPSCDRDLPGPDVEWRRWRSSASTSRSLSPNCARTCVTGLSAGSCSRPTRWPNAPAIIATMTAVFPDRPRQSRRRADAAIGWGRPELLRDHFGRGCATCRRRLSS